MTIKTVTIQIGNSDNKLLQSEWNQFVLEVGRIVKYQAATVHFFGAPPSYSEWQNAAWIIACQDDTIDSLQLELKRIRELYRQDSVAYTVGETLFI